MEEQILEEIESLRKHMVTAGLQYGLDHPTVLKYSREIDYLHNLLLSIQSSKNVLRSHRTFKVYGRRQVLPKLADKPPLKNII